MTIRKTITVSVLALVCFLGVSCTKDNQGMSIDALVPSLVKEGNILEVIGNHFCDEEAECSVYLDDKEVAVVASRSITPLEFDVIVENLSGALKKNTTSGDFDVSTPLSYASSESNEKGQIEVKQDPVETDTDESANLRYGFSVVVPLDTVDNCDAANLNDDGTCSVEVQLVDKNGKGSGKRVVTVSASSGVTPSQNTCTTNDDCSDGKICVDGGCVECTTDDDCSDGKVCQSNTCVEETTTGNDGAGAASHTCDNTPITGKCEGSLVYWCDETTSLVPEPFDCATLGKACGEDPNAQGVYTCVDVDS
jgi:Cys-rich repeat protein